MFNSICNINYCVWQLCLVVLIEISVVIGILHSGPHDTIVIEGSTVTLICSSNNSVPVMWTKMSPPSRIEDNIYHSNGTIPYKFKERFSVVKINMFQNLKITNVGLQDAGVYICIDDDGFVREEGHLRSANLTVVESKVSGYHNISSQGVITEDVCELGLQPDYINFTCSIKFRGSMPPFIKWIKNPCNCEEAAIGVISQIVLYNMVLSTVILHAQLQPDVEALSCHIYFPPAGIASLSETSLSWTSPPFKIIKFKDVETEINRTLPINETCSVETNIRCSYKWLDKERNSAVYSDVLKFDAGDCSKTGRYECSGECIIRGRVCRIEPLKVQVQTCEIGNSSTLRYKVYIVMSIISIILFGLIIVVAIFCINRRQRTWINRRQSCPVESFDKNKEVDTDSKKKQDVEIQQTYVVMEQTNKDLSVMSHECDSASQLLPNNSTENRQASRLPIMQTKEGLCTDLTETNKECSESYSLLNDEMSTNEGPDADNVFHQDPNNKDSQETNQAVPTSKTFETSNLKTKEASDFEKKKDGKGAPEVQQNSSKKEVIGKVKKFITGVDKDILENKTGELITYLNENSALIDNEMLQIIVNEFIKRSVNDKFMELAAKSCSSLSAKLKCSNESTTFQTVLFSSLTRLKEKYIHQTRPTDVMKQFTEFVAYLVLDMRDTDDSVFLAATLTDLVKFLHEKGVHLTIQNIVKRILTVQNSKECSPHLETIVVTLSTYLQ